MQPVASIRPRRDAAERRARARTAPTPTPGLQYGRGAMPRRDPPRSTSVARVKEGLQYGRGAMPRGDTGVIEYLVAGSGASIRPRRDAAERLGQGQFPFAQQQQASIRPRRDAAERQHAAGQWQSKGGAASIRPRRDA